MTTPLYVALNGILLLFLSFAVIKKRRTYEVSIGDGGHEDLTRAVRAHGNFCEFAPLALFMIYLVESGFAESGALIAGLLGGMLTVGRVLHAHHLINNKPLVLRIWGMMLTFATILIAAVLLIIKTLVG